MATFYITATRETHYSFEVEADTEEEAIAEMNRIELNEDVEDYAYDWYPLEVTEIEELDKESE